MTQPRVCRLADLLVREVDADHAPGLADLERGAERISCRPPSSWDKDRTFCAARVDPNASAEQEVGAGGEGCQLLGNHHDPGELLVAQRRDAEQSRAASGVRRVERRLRGDE
jgi:hypothetical protein